MFVSIRRYSDVADVSGLVREIQLDFAPRLSKMPGFVAYYAIETGDNGVTTVSVFSTATMAAESNATAAAWMSERAASPLEPVETLAGKLAFALPVIRG